MDLTEPNLAQQKHISIDWISPSSSSSGSPPQYDSISAETPPSPAGGTRTHHTSRGSSVLGATFNFVNSTVGAGCIGYGAAIAGSGGLLSLLTVIFFVILAKLSLDLVIKLAIDTNLTRASYEDLGYIAYGRGGKIAVMVSKGFFTFGCLIAFVVIVKDNFAPAMRNLVHVDDVSGWKMLLLDDKGSAFFLSTAVILPICLLRDVTPLARFSAIKVVMFLFITWIIIYLWKVIPQEESQEGDFYKNWIEVREGYIQSMGTFVFTFVAQHTVHMIFQSLRPEIRNYEHWQRVSTLSLMLSAAITLLIGFFVYATYWEHSESNVFFQYPPSPVVDAARILLCIASLFTYPMPFFSCRELIILALAHDRSHPEVKQTDEETASLLPPTVVEIKDNRWWMIPGEDVQLVRLYHVILTTSLWGISVFLALAAPSLVDVLDLVGCATGTVISFILPALFSYRLRGYTHTAAILFVVGAFVGCVGTYYSLMELVSDASKLNPK